MYLRNDTVVTLHPNFTFTGTSLPFPEMRTHFEKDVTNFGTKITKLETEDFKGNGGEDILPYTAFRGQS